MKTIQKRGHELKLGDVVVTPSSRLVVTQIEPDSFVWVVKCGEPYVPQQNIRFQDPVEVEAPALTPAQEHAEELRDALRNLVDSLDNGVRFHAHAVQPMKDAETLLAKIDPPKAPTLDEALQLLEVVRGECGLGVNYGGKVDALLDRARRAQVYP